MSLQTFSAFYYGHTVTASNNAIDFDEGGSELQATLNTGAYTLTEYADEVKRALDSAGGLTYAVAVNRTTIKLTISSSSNFTLRASSGTRVGTGAWTMMGFSATNRTGASTYQGQSGSGSEFLPQSIFFDHVAKDDWYSINDAVVNESASGRIVLTEFGTQQFCSFNIKFANDKTLDPLTNTWIENQPGAGLANLRLFMRYLITKAKIEFMPDRSDRSTFDKLILDKTSASRLGTEFKLIEFKKGPGYFETGDMTFRVVI